MLGNCDRTITAIRCVQKRQFKQNKPYPTNPTTVSDFIRKSRLDQRLTMPEVAAKLRVSRTTMSKWENGTLLPLPSYYDRITDFLGFDPFGKNRNPTVQ